METGKIDGAEFLQWLHELTVAGYERNITISADHKEAIMSIYIHSKDDIQKSLDSYVAFCRRWEALHAPGGDFYGLNNTQQ